MPDFYAETGGPLVEVELALIRLDHEIFEARDQLADWRARIYNHRVPSVAAGVASVDLRPAELAVLVIPGPVSVVRRGVA